MNSMSQISISLFELESRKKELQDQLNEINEELSHISYIVKNYKRSSKNLRLDLVEGRSSKLTIEELIIKILKNSPDGLSASQILNEMKEYGRNTKMATLYAYLSKYTKNSSTQIERVSPGIYGIKKQY